MSWWKPVAAAALAALAVAVMGGAATDLGPWYLALRKPAWQPPGFLFGPVWTVIFALTALAGVIAWRRTVDAAARRLILTCFALNALLNVAWSGLFFRLHRPDWALAEVVLLWLSIVLLIVVLRRRAPITTWLLLPYLVWVTFAAVLNLEIVRLNAPFA